MIQHMAYFRVKLLHPTDGYLGFLEERLEPGSRVFIVDCQTTWPCTKVGERHYFQAGATGGIPPESYLNGGREVREFLAREGSELGVWDPPAPDAESPEAEWGYEDAADDSLKDLCRDRHFELWRIRFQQPEDLSGPVAGFYRAWYERNGLPADRLLVDNFFLIDPQPTIRAAAVPFWTRFSVLLSVEAAHRFLDDVAGFDEIFVSPFSHGVRSLGVATPDRWQEVIHRGRSGGFLGAAPERFPQDFGVFVRFSRALRGLVRCAVPPRPSFSDLQEALDRGPLAHNITLTREV